MDRGEEAFTPLDETQLLPLDEVIEAMHWVPRQDKEGKEIEPGRCRSIPHRGMESGPTRVSRMMEAWLVHHGVVFAKTDDHGYFAWDATDRATLKPRRRVLSRLVAVGGREGWGAWLRRLGDINPKVPVGRILEERLKQYAQESGGTELRCWITADGSLMKPMFRVHTHTANEDVLRVASGSVVIEPNRRRSSILVPIQGRGMTSPIVWMPGIDPMRASAMLYERLGKYMTLSEHERALVMAWLLLVPIRELFEGGRPFVWATGEKGAGKSFLAKLASTWFYGKPKLGVFTSAARWQAGNDWPLICDDNRERRFLSSDDEEFLLTAATGTDRYRRSTQSDWGLVAQTVRAQVLLGAIGRPWNPELQRRALLLEHDRAHRTADMRDAEVIAAIRADRSAMWSGVLRLYAEHILPRLEARDHHRFADAIPQDHGQWGMREALGVMGVIMDVLATGENRWGPGGRLQFEECMELLHTRAREAARHTDPLAAALDELLHRWNVVEAAYGGGSPRRPAFDDGLFVCRPVFSLAPGERESGRLRARAIASTSVDEAEALRAQALDAERVECTWTYDIEKAEVDHRHVQLVAGFEGTYVQLHRDLMHAVQDARGLAEKFPTADEVRDAIRDCVGWSSTKKGRKGARGLRVYQWRQERDSE